MNIKNILAKIISSDLHLYFFYGFILSIPFQIRKGFLTEYSYFAGGFSEYATFFVYLSDILLILAVFLWIVKTIVCRDGNLSHSHYRSPHSYCTKRVINHISTVFNSICKNIKISRDVFLLFLSQKKYSPYKKELEGFPRKIWLFANQNRSLSLLFAFCLWLVVDLLLISGDYFSISAYQTLKFLELAVFFVYVYFNLTSFKKVLITVTLLALSGLIQAFLAISQYSLQHSVFGSKWFGEIILSPDLPGVAKIAVNGEKIMRAYGTFPHPNILAGFLLSTIFLSWYLLTNYSQFINITVRNKQFSLPSILERIKNLILHNKLDNLSSDKPNNVSRETLLSIFFTFLIFIQILALILTFSRSGWLGFFVVLFVLNTFYFYKNRLNVSRETLSGYLKNLLSNKNILNFIFLAILTTFLIICLWPEISSRNLPKRSLADLTSKNLVYYNNKEKKEKLDNYPDNVSRETLSGLENKENQDKDLVITDRLFYNKVAINNIIRRPFSGTGLGTFIFQIDNYLNVSRETLSEPEIISNTSRKNSFTLEFWRYQPAHNIYLLIASEIGITGFLILALFVVQIIKESGKNTLNKQNSEIKKGNVSRETLSDSKNREQKFIPCEKLEINTPILKEVKCKSEINSTYPQINNVSRETLLNNKNGNQELSSWEKLEGRYFTNLKNKENQDKDLATTDRLFYNKIAINNIIRHPFSGTGLGTFIFQIDNYLNVSRETLSDNNSEEQKLIPRDFLLYQKVYSVPSAWNTEKLEEFSEENISFLKGFKGGLKADLTHSPAPVCSERETTLNVSRETLSIIQTQKNLQHFLVAIFIGFLIIGFFDHYFWTIQQGRLEFWLILGLIIANGKIIKNK